MSGTPGYLTDAIQFDAQVYRIDATDPVQGYTSANGIGIANLAAQNLANRTAYLKQHMDALEAKTFLLAGNNLSELTSAATARTNLGLGSAAVHAAGDFQSALGFIPVQQGGGSAQDQPSATVKIGSAGAKLKADVGGTDYGNIAFENWVLGLGYAAGIANALQAGQAAQATANFNNLPSGTRMLFQQSAAPPGWTKDTAHDNTGIRIVSGNVGSGGTMNYTDAFTTRTPAGAVNASGTVGNTTLTTAQIPSHAHTFTSSSGSTDAQGNHSHTINDPTHAHGFAAAESGNYPSSGFSGASIGEQQASAVTAAASTGISINAVGNHSHNVTVSGTTDVQGQDGSHTHSLSLSASFAGSTLDFSVKYLDVIVAQKN